MIFSQDLHYAYGNYASFLRHLILLEKYWRNGDLILSDTASQKASGYIRSMRNRITAYEDRHKRSEAELSDSTRPDLSVPPAPDFLHLPDDETRDKPSSATSSSSAAARPGPTTTALDGSTILRIPKVPKTMPTSASPNPPEPTKIRVRTDLMHQLGLMSNTDPNAVNRNPTSSAAAVASASKKKDSFNIDHLVSSSSSRPPQPKVIAQPPPRSSNLLQLLNDPPKKQQV